MARRPKHYWLMKTEPDVFSIDDLERITVGALGGFRCHAATHLRHQGGESRVGDESHLRGNRSSTFIPATDLLGFADEDDIGLARDGVRRTRENRSRE